ncbi:MAG: hypothetical protein K8T25_20795 [Planctomycetia bacterium]|nr:hypothetical protein [Planctomycetia bacterium]
MSTDIPRDLKEFHHFLGEKLSHGGGNLSPEEALDEWRVLNPAPEELAESVTAIRRALAEMRAGDRGRAAESVVAEIRQRLQRSSQS